MVYIFDNVIEALAKSALFEFPLLVIAHATIKDHSEEDNSTSCTNLLTKEGTLQPDFRLGEVVDGKAQSDALLSTLSHSNLNDIVFVHVVEEGTSSYEQFVSIIPASAQQFPRVHVFPSPKRGLQPFAMHGHLLTPSSILKSVQVALQMDLAPPVAAGLPGMPASSSSSPGSGRLPALTALLQKGVETMNREAQRHTVRPASAPASHSSVPPAVPASSAVATSNTVAGGATGLPHMVLLDGIPGVAKKAILTSEGMDLTTVWSDVVFKLEQLRKQGGVGKVPIFSLQVGKDGPVISSKEECAGVLLRQYPTNLTVTVLLTDGTRPGSAPSPLAGDETQVTKSSDVVKGTSAVESVKCDDVNGCRMRPQSSAAAPTPAPHLAPAATKESGQPGKSGDNDDSATAQPAAAQISFRCSLPDGNVLTVAALSPQTDSLRSGVRPVVEAALGHSEFLFVTAFPPKRLSAADEGKPLLGIGIGSSSTLRIVLTTPPAPSPSQPSGTLGSAISTVAGLLRRGRPTQVPQQQPQQAPPARASVASQQGNIHLLSDMLDREEVSNQQVAAAQSRLQQLMQRLGMPPPNQQPGGEAEPPREPRKSNRYFGGNSTEFIAGGDDSDDEEKGDDDDHGDGAGPTLFPGTGHTLSGNPDPS